MSEAENNELTAGKQFKEPRSNQKLKLLYLAKILLNNTDANHDITLDEILNKLHAYDVTAARKSLYDDIAQLNDFGIKTQKTQYGRNVHYKVIGRAFELAELKLLVDSVAAAKFITEEKSNELIKKLESLISRQEAATLQRQVYVAGRVKIMNSDIMKNVDAIHNAIANNSSLSFQYCRWNMKKELEVKHDGARYHVSPWGLLWNDGNYYLIGYDHDTQVKDIHHYRVDKMKNILIENKVREGREKLKKLDIASYGKSKFGMYNGEEIKAEILCKNSAIGVLIDRFGTDVTILKKDEAHSRVFVKVADNKLFIHWIMAMGDNFKIIGPENLVKEVHDELNRLAKQYELAD